MSCMKEQGGELEALDGPRTEAKSQTPLRAPNGGAFAVGAIASINTFETNLKKPR